MQPPSQCYKCIQGSQLVPWSSTEALKSFLQAAGRAGSRGRTDTARRAALSSWNAHLASRARGCCIWRGWRAGEQCRGGLERALQGSAELGPRNKTSSFLLLLWLLAPTAPVFAVCLLEHVFAGNFGLQFGADQERATHLSVKRVGFLWRGDEPMLQHDWD